MDWDSEEYGDKKREDEEFLWSTIKEYIHKYREREVKVTV